MKNLTNGALTWVELDKHHHRAVGSRGTYTIKHRNEAFWLDAEDRYGFNLHDLPVRGKPCATWDAARVEAERIDKSRTRIGELSGC